MRELVERTIEGQPIAVGGGGGGGGARGRRSVTVNIAESPLSWLKSRGYVSARQFEAGERLRGDYEAASLGACVTMQWDVGARMGGRRAPPKGLDPTLVQITAKRRFDAAVGAAGPGLADVLWRVVCAGEGLAAAEKGLGWPARAGKLVLGLALDRLGIIMGWDERSLTTPSTTGTCDRRIFWWRPRWAGR